jgi:hypothetical protein
MRFFKILHSFFSSLGLNLLKIKNIIYLPKYTLDLLFFIFKGGAVNAIWPILGDHKNNSGSYDLQYFYQDLLVASYIFKANPTKHLDIGSRIDGFVANVASYRKIEVFDIRSNKFNLENISFKQIDLTNIDNKYINYTDSLSCLHTIEHFGLGRYGDDLDPKGHIKGFENLIKLLKPNGTLYISVPVASKTKTYFNSERVFHPKEIFNWSDKLKFVKFDLINEKGEVFLNYDFNNFPINSHYSCGIYTFKKIKVL